MEILRKGKVSAEFRAIRPKLSGKCAFPQNFYAKKLSEITVFYAVSFEMLSIYKALQAYIFYQFLENFA